MRMRGLPGENRQAQPQPIWVWGRRLRAYAWQRTIILPFPPDIKCLSRKIIQTGMHLASTSTQEQEAIGKIVSIKSNSRLRRRPYLNRVHYMS